MGTKWIVGESYIINGVGTFLKSITDDHKGNYVLLFANSAAIYVSTRTAYIAEQEDQSRYE